MRLEEGKPRHRLVKLRPATVAIKAVSKELSDSTVPGTNCTRYLKVCMGQNGWVVQAIQKGKGRERSAQTLHRRTRLDAQSGIGTCSTEWQRAPYPRL